MARSLHGSRAGPRGAARIFEEEQVAISIREGMALAVFSVGIVACVSGIGTMLSREYQQAIKALAAQSKSLHARALQEMGVVPVIDSSARLVQAVNQLIRTAVGVGAFLCLLGLALCLIGYWMIAA
jgi:dihydrodipicolinate synthase/N-acetylneuraminate lyase